MNVVILSPLQLELAAILKQFSDLGQIPKGSRYYTFTRYTNRHTELSLYFRETGSGLSLITQATEQAVSDWQPTLILLVGIAGGIKDAGIGDIVIANKAYGYDAGKETPEGFAARPDVIPTAPLMLNLAKSVEQAGQWRNYLGNVAHAPSVFYGPIAGGDKVIASTESKTYQIIKSHYNDTLAVEMESIGFAKTCLHHPQLQSLNIRSISDRIDGKTEADAGGSQPLAASVAAAFTRGLLDVLNPSNFNLTVSGTSVSSQIGDKGNSVAIGRHTVDEPPENNSAGKAAGIKELRDMIGRNRIKQVLEKMLELSAGDSELQNTILLLSQRWNNLKREERMGVISRSEASVANNRITMSVLEMLNDL